MLGSAEEVEAFAGLGRARAPRCRPGGHDPAAVRAEGSVEDRPRVPLSTAAAPPRSARPRSRAVRSSLAVTTRCPSAETLDREDPVRVALERRPRPSAEPQRDRPSVDRRPRVDRRRRRATSIRSARPTRGLQVRLPDAERPVEAARREPIAGRRTRPSTLSSWPTKHDPLPPVSSLPGPRDPVPTRGEDRVLVDDEASAAARDCACPISVDDRDAPLRGSRRDRSGRCSR